MDRASILRSLPRWSLVSVGVWTALGVVLAAQLVMSSSWEWMPAARWVARDWAPWVVLTPFVLALGVLFPMEKGRWWLSVPLHLTAAVGVVLLCDGAQRWLPPPHAPPMPGLTSDPGGPPDGRGPRPPPLRDGDAPPPRRDGPARGPGNGRGGHRLGLVGGAFSLRARLNFPLYWVLVSVAHALVFHRRAQERERRALELAASLAEARLQALRMQLQPHFLFNTLHAISTLVHENPNAADDMIASLSDFLRLTLARGDQPEQSLREELHFIDRYLAIERIRFGERLSIQKDIEPGTLDLRLPALILQPLVENAVRHGIEPRPGPGVLRLAARRNGPNLVLLVADDGVGMAADGPCHEGVGLSNTRARLRELYGTDATLQRIETSGKGSTWEIRMPASRFVAPPLPAPRP